MANEIILTFDYEESPAAEDLAEVFAALARDYRETSGGGTLVVTRVQSGSITVMVTDALLAALPHVQTAAVSTLAVMAAVNTVDKFAENLKKWFGQAKTDEGKKRLYKKGKKQSGQRSVEAIINTAAKTRSRAKVKHIKANGETLEAEITPIEAVAIKEATASPEAGPKLVQNDYPRALAARPDVEFAVEQLRQAGSENLSQSQIEAIVEIIVSTLKTSGASRILPEIASQLEIHGLYDFARAVRRHISGRTLEPPQPES
ncbi:MULTISPECIES: hypothetical protein [Bradyrhizobium]|uniref:Uncharacterized protein n=1 Tax=Bradyrhizobium elkanii TaxID=29448 RepID=A0A4U6S137_BRAEL|nr:MULTISPECIES: hypothetical protein [Bradyrhizobium]MTV16752.1 hypothetical protein [Bradyrhizobium sp. BR2003]TKV80443.1 hypothetical protein FDV58_16965 [Bradyrhizobium elkanii]